MSSEPSDLAAIDHEIAALTAQKQALEAHRATLTATWPKRCTLYAHCGKDRNWEIGEQLGLAGEALRLFVHCEEVAIDVEVAEDGSCTVVACDGQPVQRKAEGDSA